MYFISIHRNNNNNFPAATHHEVVVVLDVFVLLVQVDHGLPGLVAAGAGHTVEVGGHRGEDMVQEVQHARSNARGVLGRKRYGVCLIQQVG